MIKINITGVRVRIYEGKLHVIIRFSLEKIDYHLIIRRSLDNP